MSTAIDLTGFLGTIFDWIASQNLVDKNRIIEDRPNIDRPKPPYISYSILTGPGKVGSRDNITHETNATFRISGPRTITVSIKSYGEGSKQIMADLCDSTELQAVQQLFQLGNIAVWGIPLVADISAQLETGWEERSQLDMLMGATAIQDEDQGKIETVEYTGDVKDQEGNTQVSVDDTVTIP